MNKRFFSKLVTLLLLINTIGLWAQPVKYVNWTFSQKKIADSEYELSFKAKIAPGFHLYSQIPTEGDGPLPTVFEFDPSKEYTRIGKTKEPKPHEMAEPIWDNAVLRYFENSAVFTQRVKVLKPGEIHVKGYIDGMACNEVMCQKFNPPVDFDFKLEGIANVSVKAEDTLKMAVLSDSLKKDSLQNAKTVLSANNTVKPNTDKPFVPQADKPKKDSWIGIFIAGFLGGLLALLTPCIFPMIPMTVSFFTKQSKTKAQGVRNAIIYSISIIVIYVTLGLAVSMGFGADALNRMSTNVWFNLFFFVLLVAFALSFLGAYEIVLPSSFINKMDSKSNRGGLTGIFFMAFTLSLVSFSCTGPIIGTLLVEAASMGELAGPFWGMFGFSLALALPFGLFAAFPGWLNSLPQSGGWLNSVKVFLGFLELALAMKFASNADLVVQAHIVTRELFIVIWIVLFALLGAYLMGWFTLPHDSDVKRISVTRLMIAILSFSFTIYLIPGLWGAPLKLISGFPPPGFYSESPDGFGGGGKTQTAEYPEHAHKGPHGIPAFDDYYLAMEYAKKVGKPIMLDFTGWACVNCRKMEDQVWSDAEVKKRLSEKFVLVSLYVDEKNQLPEELKKEVEWSGTRRKLRTIGDRWSHLQIETYKSSTQPQYWIIDAEGNRYSDATSYDPDINKYINWLDEGLKKFQQENKK